ncbi:response regulator [Tellurirhabdus rosea]|uniref:response regulator n=1 Tax=Tellurirhabdus rosea TaxID=2674997 RepID=UPI00225145BB|nr:response regulator [Tellurirhabdus rosea]
MNTTQRTKATRRNYRQASILVVEDDSAQWTIIRMALQQVMPEVGLFWAASDQEAIRYLETCSDDKTDYPKLILLDLYLPRREDGWRLLGWFKNKDGALHRIPVVVLSNSTDQADVRAAYEQGVTSFLIKPLDYDHWLDYFRTLKQYWWDTVTLPDSRS